MPNISIDEGYIDVKVSLNDKQLSEAEHRMWKEFKKHCKDLLNHDYAISRQFLLAILVCGLSCFDNWLDFLFLVNSGVYSTNYSGNTWFKLTLLASVLLLLWDFVFRR